MRVVVTGAAGFIGAALAERLRGVPGIDLTLVDLQPLPAWAGDLRLQVVSGSIADLGVLARALDPATGPRVPLRQHSRRQGGGKV